MSAFRLSINGQEHAVESEPDQPLLWLLRESLGLTGTKYGCGIGVCGACTVDIDGAAVRSCSLPVEAVGARAVRTIEAEPDALISALREAWLHHQVPQCGYCQSGMIMAAAALLRDNPQPTDADLDLGLTNLCRCGTYQRIRAAVHRAAETLGGVAR